MRSEATTVDQYLDELPPDRRDAIETVRDTIVANLASGFEEVMNWGMITYQVPLDRYPNTYNGQPLMYAAVASQKNHMAVYLSAVYAAEDAREDFLSRYRETGKRLDMGKSCVRFRRLDDLPVELIGETIGSMDVERFIDVYEKARGSR
ncbi:MAG: iron chaperone [Acidimicrobiia bacterium]